MICMICLSSPSIVYPTNCQHGFCLTCVQAYLKDAITQGALYYITCPSCKLEYTEQVIQNYTSQQDFIKYLTEKKYNREVLCVVSQNKCKIDVKSHSCGTKVCKECGDLHRGICTIKCPRCAIPIEKISGCNHMVCRCKYQFCWICRGQYSRIHYRLWNVCGCPIPGAMMKDFGTLKYPNLVRVLMSIPRLVVFLLIILLLIVCYPCFCFYQTVKFHYKQFKKKKIRILLVLLFPLFYLMELIIYGPKKMFTKLQKLR